MDARVNDFLNEIDEIASLGDNSEDYEWERCFDQESQEHYYWNKKTNEVTWDMPVDFKSRSTFRKKTMYMPPRTTPLFPSSRQLPAVEKDAIKIYKIGEGPNRVVSKAPPSPQRQIQMLPRSKSAVVMSKRRKSDSDDEKIVLISSYGDDSDESEADEALPQNTVNTTKTQGKEDKPLNNGGLVVNYSDSEDEDDILEKSVEDSTKPEVVTQSHSTLFPIHAPIDVNDFQPPTEKNESEQNDIASSKAFQRKRRIGVALINTARVRPKTEEDGERKGLGFNGYSDKGFDEENEKHVNKSTYPGFKSGGVMFVKADNPPTIDNEESTEDRKGNLEDVIEFSYSTLVEKLKFLSEGHVLSPVQVMLIQIETLHGALQAGDLKSSYLKKWLEETCSDLIKLEKEAAPEGWLLQWDRSHKRYYYRNGTSGDCQWEYPKTQQVNDNDVTVCDEAMDICTTPPPPPLPPTIRSPTPPPPPIIGDCSENTMQKDRPDEKKNLSTVPSFATGEPLPPGVEPEIKEPMDGEKDNLNDALSSFYSDIAAIEGGSPKQEESDQQSIPEEPLKKKKKSNKVKLTQGLAMKKKGVSKMVEKWKTVQMSYNE